MRLIVATIPREFEIHRPTRYLASTPRISEPMIVRLGFPCGFEWVNRYSVGMPSERDIAKRLFQLRLSALCLAVAVICTCAGWWSERRRLHQQLDQQKFLFAQEL